MNICTLSYKKVNIVSTEKLLTIINCYMNKYIKNIVPIL